MADRNGTSLSLLPILSSRLVLRWSNRHRACTVGGGGPATQDVIQSHNPREKQASRGTLRVVVRRYPASEAAREYADGHIPLQFRCSAVYFLCYAAKIPLFGSVGEFASNEHGINHLRGRVRPARGRKQRFLLFFPVEQGNPIVL